MLVSSRAVISAARGCASRGYRSTPSLLAKILASDAIEAVCASTFKARGHELVELPGMKEEELLRVIPEYEGLVVRSSTKVTQKVIEAGVNLKMIGRAGTGVDNIDVKAATGRGILVVNTPGGNTISTAELAMSHILALARHIPQATASVKSGLWERSKYSGMELTGKTLGVIGMGKIGREVAQKCQAFGMSVVCYDPIVSESTIRAQGFHPVSLEELFESSHFITVHTPLTKETKNVINSSSLAQCMPGVRIINCARGGIVNEADLLAGLKSGQVGGAALDTLETEPPVEESLELRMHPNVIVTPHLGASTIEAQERVARQIAENMSNILDGGAFIGVMNSPDLSVLKKSPLVIPFVQLAERIGSMQAQLLGPNKVSSLTINLMGKDVSDSAVVDVLKASVLKGALGVLQDAYSVSYVNATSIAEELGLTVTVNATSKTNPSSGYVNEVSVDMEMDGFLNMSRNIKGTVFGVSDVRVTEIDGYNVDLPSGGGHVLLFNNNDKPGVLRKVAEKLYALGVNIDHFSLGRRGLPGSKAMGAITIDTPISPEDLKLFGKKGELGVTNLVQLDFTGISDFTFRSNTAEEVAGVPKPAVKPVNPQFSSGPCKKRPGYDLAKLKTDVLGRSHRSKLGKARLKRAIDETKRILGIPEDYLVGIVPASDTGAFEMAMWNMLGERPVDAFFWESFGEGWRDDATKHLKLKDVRQFQADYGKVPDFSQANPDHDILFTFNGTTSGARVRDLDWISDSRTGLTFNDATSAAFAMEIDWKKVDVTTYSWQKVLGGEGAHGVMVLSPRAVQRLESYQSGRPLPKIFRMTKKDKEGKVTVDAAIFKGDTINTPSMLCVEDYIDALEWADSIGGLQGLIERSNNNLKIMEKFVAENDWIHFLAPDPETRSSTSVCFTLDLSPEQVKKFTALLEKESVAYDIGSYRAAPDGLRIWCGATVEEQDLLALLPWLQWAYKAVKEGPSE